MQFPPEGTLLLVNKPLEWTSFDVVNKLKYTIRPRKIGHAGTLDPLATGLLLIGVNGYTKKLHELQGLDKVYEGILEVGKTTPSFDLETEFDSESAFDHIQENDIEDARKSFLGEIEQYPPAHSAVRINGERAYVKARKKEQVVLKPRYVTVYDFEILSIDLPEISFKVHCSKGTYIRSLAHDFGKKLGVGAYLKALKRTAIGPHKLESAYELNELISIVQQEKQKADESN